MLTCHADPLSDGVLVGSHWAGGPPQLPEGDTHKLVDSAESSCTSKERAQGPGSPPTLYPARGDRGGTALGPLPPCGETEACLHP